MGINTGINKEINNSLKNTIDTININNYKNDIDDINNKIIELTNQIDKKSLEIYDINEKNNKKISQYKLLLENMILEYHNTCKELFKNN